MGNFVPSKLEILDVDSLPEGQKVIENIVSYDWSINTKYYTADVRLCLTNERTIGDESFAELVHAFVVYFDADKKESFESVKLWNAYLKEIDPEIKMLVCDKCTDSSVVGRLEAQTWCIENGFELVELNAETESDSETEDDFLETTGIKRIVQSLHAHTWPNLNLKEEHHVVSPFMRQLMKEEHDAKQLNSDNKTCDDTNNSIQSDNKTSLDDRLSSENLKTNNSENQSVSCDGHVTDTESKNNFDNDDNRKDVTDGKSQEVPEGGACGNNKKEKSKKNAKKQSKEERLDSMLPAEDMALFEALGSEDPEGESFEKLFEKFAHMKEKANNLPLQERKKYAENVAIAFWRAMGGDEDEIGDLDADG